MHRESIHAHAVRVRAAIAGDLDAAERYERLGRPEDAEAARASARSWHAELTARLQGKRRR